MAVVGNTDAKMAEGCNTDAREEENTTGAIAAEATALMALVRVLRYCRLPQKPGTIAKLKPGAELCSKW
jgi:hypothetical protein